VRKPFRVTIVAPLLAGILAVSAAAVAGTWSVRTPEAGGEAPRTLVLHGKVRGLYPGKARPLRVRVHNSLSVRVGVYRVSARARRTTGPLGRCPARVIWIKPWRGMRFVPAGATRSIRLRVRLARRAPDRCQGVRWRVTYDARSVRV
jgi:hypothetical protein